MKPTKNEIIVAGLLKGPLCVNMPVAIKDANGNIAKSKICQIEVNGVQKSSTRDGRVAVLLRNIDPSSLHIGDTIESVHKS